MLKTLLFYAIERMPVDYWFNTDHLLKIILGIIDDFIFCLAVHECPHYFIPEVNLFNAIPVDFFPKIARQLGKYRKVIIDNPNKVCFGD